MYDKLLDIACIDRNDITEEARTFARFSLFDWLTVGVAGRHEPLAKIITDYVKTEGATPVASTFAGEPTSVRLAALANGTISHALDYDDTHFAHVGHLSVAIYPAAFAALEARNATISELLDTFIISAETACRFGTSLGAEHYRMGFHQTATSGAIGATVAAGRALGLTRGQMATALSLVATRASGLKSQFGTMGKPFNAGIAAANGIEVASLAQRGITAPDDGLYGPQGFAQTHGARVPVAAAFDNPPPGRFVFTDNKYKFHACCHGLHALIEGLAKALARKRLDPQEITAIEIKTNPRWLNVCNIARPRTGLEVKFSYPWLAAMVITGHDTAAETTYSDACATDAELARIASRVTVTGDDALTDTATTGSVTTKAGDVVKFHADIAEPTSTRQIASRLQAKAKTLLGSKQADALRTTLEREENRLSSIARLF